MKQKLLFKSEHSLSSHPMEIITEGENHYTLIKAEEEHKIWGEKLFPGDDRDYEVQKHPVEIIWEVANNELIEKLKELNRLDSPLILFTFEGVKPRVLLDVEVIKEYVPEHLENKVVIFPNNPKEEREKRIEEEEEWLSNLDLNT